MPAILSPEVLRQNILKKIRSLKRDMERLRRVDPVGAKIYFRTDQEFISEIQQIQIISERKNG